MRTLYFDLDWLAREERSDSLKAEFVVRVSPLLQETILALFDGRNDPERTELLVRLAMLELHQAEDSTTFIPLPHEPRCRRAADIVLADPTGAPRDRNAGARGRHLGADAVAAVFVGDAIELQELVPARADRLRDREVVDGRQVSVKQLASDLGYASVPAFSHAFRQVTGKTPTEFAEKK